MSVIQTAKCGNCADACLLNFYNKPNLKIFFCKHWSETVNENHSCNQFKNIEVVKYCHIQDLKTNIITRYKYPF